MRLTGQHKGVYVTFRDKRRRRKSESLTVDGYTPKQLLRVVADYLRDQKRKAG